MNQRLEPTATDRLREQSATLNHDLHGLGRATKDVAKEYVQQGRQKIDDAAKQIAAYVRERPVKVLAMTASVGILLGYLLGRRR